MSADEVGNAFVQHYYQAFDSDANGLAGLYVSSGASRSRARRSQ